MKRCGALAIALRPDRGWRPSTPRMADNAPSTCPGRSIPGMHRRNAAPTSAKLHVPLR